MQAVMARTTSPHAIAIARIGVGLAAGMTVVEGYQQLLRARSGHLTMPAVAWLPTPTTSGASVLAAMGCVAALGLVIGYRTRLAATLSIFCELAFYVWEMQTYSSHRMLVTLLCTYLLFARSDARWSIRSRQHGAHTEVPYWPQLLMMSQLSACYLFAGLSKVNPVFLHGIVLRESMHWSLPAWMLVGLSLMTVVTEIFLAVALWLRRANRVAVALGCVLHLSIVIMLKEPFPLVAFALACASLYPLFLDRTRGAETPAAAPLPRAAVAVDAA